MNDTLFKVSSITYAYKGRDALRNMGIKVYIERETKGNKRSGCGYVLRVSKDAYQAEQILKANGIRILGRAETGDIK